ncbi:hypothetical protein O181_099042 [Austropuccinia psidii MF-1]|uniref:Integrase zinc-binding domain-containing protein n=1 Tax=Austropuccinia psidii MF-1 TaxID=1389203 RepID=A0A9Q3PG52_9BASI|nr:hypothetical protein [Austropuccinia psidii MF-1]
MDRNCQISCQFLMKDCKDPLLSSKLDELLKKEYDEGSLHLLGGILYNRTKHTCFMTLKNRGLINTIIHEIHDSVFSGHLSEDRTPERAKTCSWWPNCRKYVSENCQTCDRCQKENRASSKKFGMIIQIQEPKYPWEIIHMDWVSALPPGGERSFNACLSLVDRYGKTPMLLPSNKDEKDIETAIMICDRSFRHTGLL